MSAGDNEVFFNAALSCAKKAGELVLSKVTQTKQIDLKSSEVDLVTQTDKDVENLLIQGLRSQFPDHKFIGEESVAGGAQCDLTDSPTWIIDPIDGTMNFVHNYPHSCISIALFVRKTPQVAIVYNPSLNQLFTAKKGEGAFLNGQRIKVSGESDLSKALISAEFGSSREEEKLKVVLENFSKLVGKIHGFRSLGSAALNMCMVALGSSDAYYEYGIHVWDIAAGELLVTEAGGVVIDPAGGPLDRMSRRVLAAGSQTLADALTKTLVQFHPEPRD